MKYKSVLQKKKRKDNEFQCIVMATTYNFDSRQWKKVHTLLPLKYSTRRKSIHKIFGCRNEHTVLQGWTLIRRCIRLLILHKRIYKTNIFQLILNQVYVIKIVIIIGSIIKIFNVKKIQHDKWYNNLLLILVDKNLR